MIYLDWYYFVSYLTAEGDRGSAVIIKNKRIIGFKDIEEIVKYIKEKYAFKSLTIINYKLMNVKIKFGWKKHDK